MKPVESFFERKKWEQVMLVRDGSSVLYFLNNGGLSEQYEHDWLSIDRAVEEFDKAEILVMTKGFTKVEKTAKDPGPNPDYY